VAKKQGPRPAKKLERWKKSESVGVFFVEFFGVVFVEGMKKT